MKVLFIHQNLPGQFRHLLLHLARDPANDVVAIGEKKRILANVRRPIHGIRLYGYELDSTPRNSITRDLWTAANSLRRGRAVAVCLKKLRSEGFFPDVVYGHPGWGEMLHVRDVFPDARMINYCEFYFNRDGQDYAYDPEFPDSDPDGFRIRTENMPQLISLVAADAGISPTPWQRSRYPVLFQQQISVIPDGIDLNVVKPDASARVHLRRNSLTLRKADQVITYVSRNLEPYRGFHVFMRSLSALQRYLPRAHVLIVGGDEVSYGRPPETGTYRQKYLSEVGEGLDMSRVHFLGRLAYNDYLRILQISTAHVYMTYPFVLSWSMLEAMGSGAAIIGSRTAPVEDVINDGHNGLMVDFFSTEELVDSVIRVCSDEGLRQHLSDTAVQTVRDRFDLHSICLPHQLEMLRRIG